MAGEGNISFWVETPYVSRQEGTGPGSLFHALQSIGTEVGLTVGQTITFDIVASNFAYNVCHNYSTVLYPLEYCCITPSAGPSEGEPPTSQIPTLLDHLEPLLDTFQLVPVEQDDHIFIQVIRCYPVASIPLEDLAAVAVGIEDDPGEPQAPPNPTALEGIPDPFEGYDRVDVTYGDVLTRYDLPSSQCSLDPAATESDAQVSQLMVTLPTSTSDENAARLADTLRLRSQVERPVTFWTAPKWLKLNLNDVVTINPIQGPLNVRITNISIGADWVVQFDGVLCNRLAHYPYEFFATNDYWPVPTVEQMTQGLDYGFDPSYSNGTGGAWDTVRFAPPGQLPPGVDPVEVGN